MASSGITAYTYTRDQIINAALRKLGVLSEGVSANATQLSTGAEALNLLILQLQALGMPLWARKTLSTTMVVGTNTYTLTTPKPMRLYQAYRTDTANTNNMDMAIVPDYDFTLLPHDSTGNPINITYQPKIGSGILKVWPTPDATMPAGTQVNLTYHAEFEVFTAGSETPDFPQEWYLTLVYQLAHLLATEYGTPTQDQSNIEKQAEKHLATVLGIGMEDGSFFIQPGQQY